MFGLHRFVFPSDLFYSLGKELTVKFEGQFNNDWLEIVCGFFAFSIAFFLLVGAVLLLFVGLILFVLLTLSSFLLLLLGCFLVMFEDNEFFYD